MKAEIPFFQIKSFLPPSLIFYPPFLALKLLLKAHFLEFFTFSEFSDEKMRGQKTSRGAKTFDLKNMESQLSFAQKISKKSSKLVKIAKNEIWPIFE